ncbi:RNA polymerase sigma factor [uncultured Robinsoniella sp.]|uniref:RNA polymerase sigma factor n=2 Tax=Robinsoniella TaxID=588605 RepID=UPI00374E8057
MCHDEAIAEEITQEIFLKAMQNIHRFKGECKIQVWLCQIGKHQSLYWRKREQAMEMRSIRPNMELEVESIFVFQYNPVFDS